MKNITSIEIPANILSALASNPGDPRLAMEVCSALVKAAEILNGEPPEPSDVAAGIPDTSVIVERAHKRRERRRVSALRRASRRQERDRQLARFVSAGIRDMRLADLKSSGILTATEMRIVEAMLRPTIQLTNKLTARQIANILQPRIGRMAKGIMDKVGSSALPVTPT